MDLNRLSMFDLLDDPNDLLMDLCDEQTDDTETGNSNKNNHNLIIALLHHCGHEYNQIITVLKYLSRQRYNNINVNENRL